MLNIGSTSTGGRIQAVRADLAKIVLTAPVRAHGMSAAHAVPRQPCSRSAIGREEGVQPSGIHRHMGTDFR